jgi:hypothetical protein
MAIKAIARNEAGHDETTKENEKKRKRNACERDRKVKGK